MITGPRYKICKRLGSGVFEKCQTQKFALSEQRRVGKKRQSRPRRSPSDYGKQLIEKQKARFTYGITERQLARYVHEAASAHGIDPIMRLLEFLEMRLDNVVFRMGLAPTRRAARQIVSHGHITVNGQKVTIPSYHLKENENVAIRENSRSRTFFAQLSDRFTDITLPSWITFNPASFSGSVLRRPTRDDVELFFDPTVVLEFYSR